MSVLLSYCLNSSFVSSAWAGLSRRTLGEGVGSGARPGVSRAKQTHMPSHQPDWLIEAVEAVRNDRTSGASGILDAAIDILGKSLAEGVAVEAARALCRAQPSMAPVWNASLQAVAVDGSAERFDRFVLRIRRAPSALVRIAETVLLESQEPEIRLVTISASGSVMRIVEHLQRIRPVTVLCAEGRPAFEGRLLATRLAAEGVRVVYFTDAALAAGLEHGDAVLVGADAVGPDAWLNKSGTFMLAAAASVRGVPVYVAATRDKFAMPALWPRLSLREGAPDDVWREPPEGCAVRNPYFEKVPLDVLTGVITDTGLLAAGMVADVCESMQDAGMLAALDQVTGDF